MTYTVKQTIINTQAYRLCVCVCADLNVYVVHGLARAAPAVVYFTWPPYLLMKGTSLSGQPEQVRQRTAAWPGSTQGPGRNLLPSYS